MGELASFRSVPSSLNSHGETIGIVAPGGGIGFFNNEIAGRSVQVQVRPAKLGIVRAGERFSHTLVSIFREPLLKNPMSDQADTLRLIDRYRTGDEAAAKELFDRYVSRLIGLVHGRMNRKLGRRLDPEDIVQSTFRSFFSGVQHDRYQFDEPGDLWRLLTVMALNKLRHKVEFHGAIKRGLANEQSMSGSADDERRPDLEVLATQPLPDAAAAVIEELALLTSDLEPVQAEMITLRMQGYQLEEIAELVDRSERTVRRVLEKIRQRWAERVATLASD